jgi:hypothetical protein
MNNDGLAPSDGVTPADQPTKRTTPPSTRNAAPLVAEACSEHA